MLVSHRRFRVPALGVRMDSHLLLHSQFRISVWAREGVLLDEAVLARKLDISRPSVRSLLFVPLIGGMGVELAGSKVWLDTGECLLTSWRHGSMQRSEGASLTLAVEWEEGLVGRQRIRSPQSFRLSPGSREALLDASLRLMGSRSGAPGLPALANCILEVLRSEGAPFEATEAACLEEEVDARMVQLEAAMDRALSVDGKRASPMLVDLEEPLGMTRRQVQWTLRSYLGRYHFTSRNGWRDILQMWRISRGAALLTAPAATTEFVAEILGYSCPTAFCRAFAGAGLPSPGEIRRLIHEG